MLTSGRTLRMAGWFFVVGLAAGCGGSHAPTLSISSGDPNAQSAQARLIGTWNGQFVMHKDADPEAFDPATVEACKSMQIRITFRADGTMSIAASIQLPEIGTQSNETQGKWTLVSHQNDQYVVRTQEGDSEPEEVTLYFRGENQFEMLPPTQLSNLGVMRFVRKTDSRS
ncbi:MAG: hypothetical protein KatS3mg110_4195 [Pirellulaceae bacterium]|nr:MAG: hypothetical protein KatS3mg110_4195 [Pirellulaceae bacterium]